MLAHSAGGFGDCGNLDITGAASCLASVATSISLSATCLLHIDPVVPIIKELAFTCTTWGWANVFTCDFDTKNSWRLHHRNMHCVFLFERNWNQAVSYMCPQFIYVSNNDVMAITCNRGIAGTSLPLCNWLSSLRQTVSPLSSCQVQIRCFPLSW